MVCYSQWKVLHLIKPLMKIVTTPFAEVDNVKEYSKCVYKLTQIFSIDEHKKYLWQGPKEGKKYNHFLHQLNKRELEWLRENFPLED